MVSTGRSFMIFRALTACRSPMCRAAWNLARPSTATSIPGARRVQASTRRRPATGAAAVRPSAGPVYDGRSLSVPRNHPQHPSSPSPPDESGQESLLSCYSETPISYGAWTALTDELLRVSSENATFNDFGSAITKYGSRAGEAWSYVMPRGQKSVALDESVAAARFDPGPSRMPLGQTKVWRWSSRINT